jgi:hypothetical protein
VDGSHNQLRQFTQQDLNVAPTTDGRELVLTRYAQPKRELQLLIEQLRLQLPPHPPPRITAAALAQAN